MRVMGIDPGSNFLGLGCVEGSGNSLHWVGHRVLHVSSAKEDSLGNRLRAIHLGVMEALDLWKPEVVAVEEVFFAKNPKSALKLGQARGAALTGPAILGLPLFEYSATLVKQTVTGSGRAEKEQVERMIRALLGGRAGASLDFQRSDASDALAVAICHWQHRQRPQTFRPQQQKKLSPPPFGR